jgi:hypothetical protein
MPSLAVLAVIFLGMRLLAGSGRVHRLAYSAPGSRSRGCDGHDGKHQSTARRVLDLLFERSTSRIPLAISVVLSKEASFNMSARNLSYQGVASAQCRRTPTVDACSRGTVAAYAVAIGRWQPKGELESRRRILLCAT